VEIPHEVQECVAFIGFDRSGKGDPDSIEVCGTCFLVMLSSKVVPKGGHAYLVTAKHLIDLVAHMGRHEVYVRLSRPGAKVEWIGTHAADWLTHPTDSLVDVAVLPFPQSILTRVDQRLFPMEGAATQTDLKELGIGVGEDVFFPGLFLPHFGKDRNLPIMRTGTIAAMPVEKIRVSNGLVDAYLVEARSIGGLSGSPVFVRMDSRVSADHFLRKVVTHPRRSFGLLGLIRGHYEDEVLSNITVHERKAEAVNMGIGIVVPVEQITETLMHPELLEKFERDERQLAQEVRGIND
jgi:hypothetical protein